MLGNFYQFEANTCDDKMKECSRASLKMYENSIICARKLNPTWTDDRSHELTWGEITHRPYLRSLNCYSQALHIVGRTSEAIAVAKKLLRWNPGDNQGIRSLLCSWYVANGDAEGCTNLLRKYEKFPNASLTYSDVLLQFLRWKKMMQLKTM